MQKLIIICGLSGSGKTTLAKELSRKLGLVCLHKDAFKENMFDILGLSTLDDSKRVGAETVKLMYKIVEEQIANGQSIIIEAPFNYADDYDMFRRWEKEYELKIYTIQCSVDHEERLKRFKTRQRHHSHHDLDRLHMENFVSDESVYEHIPGKKLKIEANKAVSDMVKEVINYYNL